MGRNKPFEVEVLMEARLLGRHVEVKTETPTNIVIVNKASRSKAETSCLLFLKFLKFLTLSLVRRLRFYFKHFGGSSEAARTFESLILVYCSVNLQFA